MDTEHARIDQICTQMPAFLEEHPPRVMSRPLFQGILRAYFGVDDVEDHEEIWEELVTGGDGLVSWSGLNCPPL